MTPGFSTKSLISPAPSSACFSGESDWEFLVLWFSCQQEVKA